MDFFIKFLYDFMSQFFGGLFRIFKNIGLGIYDMFNVKEYASIISVYKEDISGGGWVLVALVVIVFLVILLAMIYLLFFLVRKYVRLRKSLVNQESLLEEVAELNRSVLKLTHEKDKIMAMKVSQLGIKPGETDALLDESLSEEQKEENDEIKDIKSRFARLTLIDQESETREPDVTNDTFTLEKLCDDFRNYAGFKLQLYYNIQIIRLFVASLSSSRLIILQGISGTGKTSLPYAWGKFIKNDAVIASVQPSWKDRTELFGYFNEFTQRFNETEVLTKMYEATWRDVMYLTILDEMNIARVEYYFAEMLSILEMPSREEWIIELVSSSWPDDPKHIVSGKLRIPDNMWYIGTINNDDSTFMVTDKVYDRAMPIDINEKAKPFDAPSTEGYQIKSTYLEGLFKEAKEKHAIGKELMDKLEEMDNYVIEHFRLAFGNRIVKHINEFIPVYVACGGTEIEAFDYIIAKKILRKFEQLNLAFIREEIDGFVKFLDSLFGKDNMKECKAYLFQLKKLM